MSSLAWRLLASCTWASVFGRCSLGSRLCKQALWNPPFAFADEVLVTTTDNKKVSQLALTYAGIDRSMAFKHKMQVARSGPSTSMVPEVSFPTCKEQCSTLQLQQKQSRAVVKFLHTIVLLRALGNTSARRFLGGCFRKSLPVNDAMQKFCFKHHHTSWCFGFTCLVPPKPDVSERVRRAVSFRKHPLVCTCSRRSNMKRFKQLFCPPSLSPDSGKWVSKPVQRKFEGLQMCNT